jgi:hypothetical protein
MLTTAVRQNGEHATQASRLFLDGPWRRKATSLGHRVIITSERAPGRFSVCRPRRVKKATVPPKFVAT